MIVLRADQLAAVEGAATAAFPLECCGLLVGCDGADGAIEISRIVPSPNIAAAPARRFEIDPRLWLELGRTLDGGPERIVGLYHSHPGGEAAPSRTDRDSAWEPAQVWLITAVAEGWAIETRAFLFEDMENGFRELSIARGG
jgi:proteasome lid subunit RPN8/RPN11